MPVGPVLPAPGHLLGSDPPRGDVTGSPEPQPPTPLRAARLFWGRFMGILETLALICIVLGVILLILGVFGITGGLTYGTHGAVTLIVIGIILYVVLLLVPHAV